MSERKIQWLGQSQQDRFAAEANGFNPGTYLEIGAGPWWAFNNTYQLVNEFGWTGVSVEINPQYVADWRKNRPNDHLIEADATTLYYPQIVGDWVDYLQIDIDPAEQSLTVLKRILDQGVRFRALTFEHDAYCSGGMVRADSRMLLKDAGYKLYQADVIAPGYGVYEDWWLGPPRRAIAKAS